MTKTPDQEIRDSRNAERILRDPLFKEAFETIESSLIDRMRRVPMADVATQHELVLSLQLLGNLKRHFEIMLETGKMAEIQKSNTLKDKIRRIAG